MRTTAAFSMLTCCAFGCLPGTSESNDAETRPDDDAAATAATAATDAAATTDSATASTPPNDTSVADTPPVFTGSSSVPVACYAGPLGATGIVGFDNQVSNMMPVVFDGGALFGSRDRTSGDGVDLVAHDLARGAEHVVTPVAGLVHASDGRDGALVYARVDEVAHVVALTYLDPDLDAPMTLAAHAGFGLGPSSFTPPPFGWEHPMRVVERGTAVWLESFTDPERGASPSLRLRAMHAGAVATLWVGEDALGVVPVLRQGRVAWAHGAPDTLWLADAHAGGAVPAQAVADGRIRDYTLTDDALWWIDGGFDGGRVMRLDLASDEVREVDPGPCLMLAGDATRVVTICGDDLVRRATFGLVEGGRPVVLDGAHRTVLPVGGEALAATSGPPPAGIALAAPSVAGARVVWGEYPPLVTSEPCHPGPGAAHLAMAELDASGAVTAVHAVAEVQVGCWCCGGIFQPDPDVRLTASGLAWNYATLPGGAAVPSGVSALGWILFDTACATAE